MPKGEFRMPNEKTDLHFIRHSALAIRHYRCSGNSMAECQSSKLGMWVRLPPTALVRWAFGILHFSKPW